MVKTRVGQVLPWIGLAVLVVVATWVAPDYSPTYDEAVHVVSGDSALAWYGSGFQQTASLTARAFKDYGAFADFWVQLVANVALLAFDAPLYPTRHWLQAMIGIGGIVLVFRLASLVGGSGAGWAAALLLTLAPRWLADSFNNPKDIPFAVAWLASVYGMARIVAEQGRAGWMLYLWTGLAMGAAMGIRIGGILLVPLLAVAGLAAGREPGETWRRAVGRVTVRTGMATVMAWTVMLIFWPSAQVSPLRRPFEVLLHMSAFPFDGGMLFQGEWIQAREVPWNYIPVWLGITLPETILVGLVLWLVALGVWFRSRPRVWRLSLVIGLAAVGPWALAVIKGSPLYDGMRHFFFVVPLLAVLAGLGWAATWERIQRRWWKAAVLSVFGVGCALNVWDIVTLHPYQAVYFNRLSGGLPGAADRFDLDYWGQTYAEGAAWLRVRPAEEEGWVAVPFMAKRLASVLDPEGEHARRKHLVRGFLGLKTEDPPDPGAARWQACGLDWHPERMDESVYRMVARRTRFGEDWEKGDPVFEVRRHGLWLLRIWRMDQMPENSSPSSLPPN